MSQFRRQLLWRSPAILGIDLHLSMVLFELLLRHRGPLVDETYRLHWLTCTRNSSCATDTSCLGSIFMNAWMGSRQYGQNADDFEPVRCLAQSSQSPPWPHGRKTTSAMPSAHILHTCSSRAAPAETSSHRSLQSSCIKNCVLVFLVITTSVWKDLFMTGFGTPSHHAHLLKPS